MLTGVLAACGGEDVVVRETPTPQQRGVAPPAGDTVRSDPLRDARTRRTRMTITVENAGRAGFRYRAPATVPGGLVEIRLRNRDDVPRKAQLWRIDGGHTVKEALRVGTRSPTGCAPPAASA